MSYGQLFDAVSSLDVIQMDHNSFDPAGSLTDLVRQGESKGVRSPQEYAVKNWIVRAQNVLITTEETLLPFLRLIRSAWVQKEQMENMSQIVSGAQKMLDRVALFSEKNAEVENALRQTLRKMEENSKRLVEGRQSIARAAQEVLDCGVSPSPGKSLPEAQ